MICVVLAAGYATRLYPLTESFPKPLLPVGGKTILDWMLDDVHASGMARRYVIISNHKFFSRFSIWANGKSFTVDVVDDLTTSNETRLGAVRDLQFAMDALRLDDDLLVVAADNMLDFSLTPFIIYAQQKKASCVMRYYEKNVEHLRKSGVLRVDCDDLVLEMREKPAAPTSHWCCPPFYYFTREDAKQVAVGIAAGCGTDAPGSFAAWLCGQSPVYAMKMPGKRYDIGSLENYRAVERGYLGLMPRGDSVVYYGQYG